MHAPGPCGYRYSGALVDNTLDALGLAAAAVFTVDMGHFDAIQVLRRVFSVVKKAVA